MLEDEYLSFPEPPTITSEELEQCRVAGDLRPLLFKWYKHVGLISNYFASIRSDSAAIRKLPILHYSVLIGLLNRCSRLMFANVALSKQGVFGETTSIIDRCIFETVVKIMWLCKKQDQESFSRLIADGLKTELEFKTIIERNIADHGGHPSEIETRMLKSIGEYVKSSSLSEEEIAKAKRLPDLNSMIEAIGWNRLHYVVGQRIGCHHVHGSWVSLRFHYLEEREGRLGPRDHDCDTHANQYVFISLFVLMAARAFVEFVCLEPGATQAFCQRLEATEEEIQNLNMEMAGQGFSEMETAN